MSKKKARRDVLAKEKVSSLEVTTPDAGSGTEESWEEGEVAEDTESESESEPESKAEPELERPLSLGEGGDAESGQGEDDSAWKADREKGEGGSGRQLDLAPDTAGSEVDEEALRHAFNSGCQFTGSLTVLGTL